MYEVSWTRRVEKQIGDIPEPDQGRIRAAIADLAKDPRPHGCLKLKGQVDLYRIRIGNYRVIYSIDDGLLVVEVVKVGDRKDIY